MIALALIALAAVTGIAISLAAALDRCGDLLDHAHEAETM